MVECYKSELFLLMSHIVFQYLFERGWTTTQSTLFINSYHLLPCCPDIFDSLLTKFSSEIFFLLASYIGWNLRKLYSIFRISADGYTQSVLLCCFYDYWSSTNFLKLNGNRIQFVHWNKNMHNFHWKLLQQERAHICNLCSVSLYICAHTL